MKNAKTIMRPIAEVYLKPVRNGHIAQMRLTCAHVIEWKASRFRTYKPDRLRCEECLEVFRAFMDDKSCAQVVNYVERGKAHDFTTNNGGSGVANFRGYANLHGRTNSGPREAGPVDTSGLGVSRMHADHASRR